MQLNAKNFRRREAVELAQFDAQNNVHHMIKRIRDTAIIRDVDFTAPNRKARRAMIATRRKEYTNKNSPLGWVNEILSNAEIVLHPTRGYRRKSFRNAMAAAIMADIKSGGKYSTARMAAIMRTAHA